LTLVSTVLIATALASPAAAQPDDAQGQAALLFEQGVAARTRGDARQAALHFAAADARLANSAALLAALKAVLLTEDALLAMELADRASRDPFDEGLRSAAVALRDKFAKRCGRIKLRCGRMRAGCALSIDGGDVAVDAWHWVAVGQRRLRVSSGTRHRARSVEVSAGVSLELDPEQWLGPQSGPTLAPTTEVGGGLVAPAWFWLSVGLTTGFGAATVASAVDTIALHDDFEQSPAAGPAREGQLAQDRTNALLAANLSLVALTTTLGIAAFWRGESSRAVKGSAQLWRGGLKLGVAASF